MFVTNQEILTQYKTLRQTFDEMHLRKDDIISFMKDKRIESISYIGSGSSYCIAKSAATTTRVYMRIPSYSLNAGDFLVNCHRYLPALDNSMFISLSRSGNTSEILYSIEKAKKLSNFHCISICQQRGSGMAELADLSLELPWAFDSSVCQTRSVTNLYFASMMLISFLSGNEKLEVSLKAMLENGQFYMDQNRDIFEEIALRDWNNVVILADAELEGIADEGTLAFKEIARLPAVYYHALDVRHGPIVMIDQKTLVIIVISPDEISYQKALIEDLKVRGATVIALNCPDQKDLSPDYNITLPAHGEFASYGIPFILIPQMLAYLRAVASGINPDAPAGLSPFIKL